MPVAGGGAQPVDPGGGARGLAQPRDRGSRRARRGAGRVALQSIAEIVPLLVAGGVLGVALAWYTVSAFIPLAPASLPRVEDIRVSTEVLLVSIVVLSLTGADRRAAAGGAGLARGADDRDS